jgi:hypothetical protein
LTSKIRILFRLFVSKLSACKLLSSSSSSLLLLIITFYITIFPLAEIMQRQAHFIIYEKSLNVQVMYKCVIQLTKTIL